MADYTMIDLYPLRLKHVRALNQLRTPRDKAAFLQAAYRLQTGQKPSRDLPAAAAGLLRQVEADFEEDDRPCGIFVVGSDCRLGVRFPGRTYTAVERIRKTNPEMTDTVMSRFDDFLGADAPLDDSGLDAEGRRVLVMLRSAAEAS